MRHDCHVCKGLEEVTWRSTAFRLVIRRPHSARAADGPDGEEEQSGVIQILQRSFLRNLPGTTVGQWLRCARLCPSIYGLSVWSRDLIGSVEIEFLRFDCPPLANERVRRQALQPSSEGVGSGNVIEVSSQPALFHPNIKRYQFLVGASVRHRDNPTQTAKPYYRRRRQRRLRTS